jgi:hypothetical protein
MKPRYSALWWLLLTPAWVLGATRLADWTDPSPHTTQFITVNRVKLHYLDAAADRASVPDLMKQAPPELAPTKADLESLDSFRRWLSRMTFWSEAWEANLREMMVFSPDGKILREAKPGHVSRLMMEGTKGSRPDYSKIRSPALSLAAVGFSSKVAEVAKALPDSKRSNLEDYLSQVTRFQRQEIERFRTRVPNGRVIELSNTDHHCFIHRANEVVAEMRRFLQETRRD